jgi:hypothetical protein
VQQAITNREKQISSFDAFRIIRKKPLRTRKPPVGLCCIASQQRNKAKPKRTPCRSSGLAKAKK